MTAINVFIRHDAIHIATDTAGTDAAGNLVLHIDKVRLLPTLNAALVVRGNLTNASIIHELFTRAFATFEELKEGAVEALQSLTAALEHAPDVKFGEAWDAVVAGYGKDGPAVGMVCNHDMHAPSGVPAWTWIDVPAPSIVMPVVSVELLRKAGADPVPHLVAVLQEQRQGMAERGEVVNVGGRAVHTVVNRKGVSSRVIGEWPDVIGEKLRPEAEFREAMAEAA